MVGARALAALLAVGIVGGGAVPTASPPAREAVARGAAYLIGRQEPSGAFFSPDAPADGAAEVVSALVAAGASGEAVPRAMAYVRRKGRAAAVNGGRTGRLVMGIVAGGGDPRTLGGVDYVARLKSFYDPDTGAYHPATIYGNALAALGVLAAGEALPARAVSYFRENQCPTGGFAWRQRCAGLPDTDNTALALSALVAAGLPADDGTRARARDFLISTQGADGGWGLDAVSRETNANSTGLVLSAIAALGEDPLAPPWRQADGDNPVDALLALQHRSGGFRYRASDGGPNDYATVQALPGLAGRAYPVRPRPVARQSGKVGARVTAAPTGAPSVRAAAAAPSAVPTPAGYPAPPERATSVLAEQVRRPERRSGGMPALAWAAAAALVLSAALLGRRLVLRR